MVLPGDVCPQFCGLDMINKVFPKLLSLEQKVKAMETHLNGISRVYGSRNNSSPEEGGGENLDDALKCDKCSTFLGFFDVENKQFRFRYRGLVIYWIAGDDGSITIICNNCSYANNLGYITCENES